MIFSPCEKDSSLLVRGSHPSGAQTSPPRRSSRLFRKTDLSCPRGLLPRKSHSSSYSNLTQQYLPPRPELRRFSRPGFSQRHCHHLHSTGALELVKQVLQDRSASAVCDSVGQVMGAALRAVFLSSVAFGCTDDGAHLVGAARSTQSPKPGDIRLATVRPIHRLVSLCNAFLPGVRMY